MQTAIRVIMLLSIIDILNFGYVDYWEDRELWSPALHIKF